MSSPTPGACFFFTKRAEKLAPPKRGGRSKVFHPTHLVLFLLLFLLVGLLLRKFWMIQRSKFSWCQSRESLARGIFLFCLIYIFARRFQYSFDPLTSLGGRLLLQMRDDLQTATSLLNLNRLPNSKKILKWIASGDCLKCCTIWGHLVFSCFWISCVYLDHS